MGRLHVFLCDDAPELRRLVRLGLEGDPSLVVVGEADDGPSGVAGIAELQPDVVFLDLSMPGMDGLEAIPHIRRASPRTAIVVFSGFAAERMARVALRQGAHGYVEKGAPMQELHQAAHAAATTMQRDSVHARAGS
jgi:DNA-binding NarL/FixJ family response regulator